jgi:hypothetical protein
MWAAARIVLAEQPSPQASQMDCYAFILPPESLGGHVHFSVKMRGIDQHIFVSTILVESDAGRMLGRGEAANYVMRNTRRFVDAAQQKIGQGPTGPITLGEGDHLPLA